MNLMNSSYEITKIESISSTDILRHIEKVGRTAYKSEEKITASSAEAFVEMIIKRGHLSVIEHGYVIIEIPTKNVFELLFQGYLDIIKSSKGIVFSPANKFLEFSSQHRRYLISGNLRAFRELTSVLPWILPPITYDIWYIVIIFLAKVYPWLFEGINIKYDEEKFPPVDLKIVAPDKLSADESVQHRRVSVRIICDRGVSYEIVRHRLASYTQESTRYCNYSKREIDGSEGINVIKPLFWEEGSSQYIEWFSAMIKAEQAYNELIALEASPQEARSVLPNSLKTEIVVTMNLREWLHFFKMRTAKAAHPQMREIAVPMLEDFKQIFPFIMVG